MGNFAPMKVLPLLVAAAAMIAARLALAAAPAASAVAVAPGVHLLPGGFDEGTQPDGNTIILDAPGGLIVVDSGRHRAHTAAILDYAAVAKAPIAAVINTHWHLDHIGGNPLLRERHPGLSVYASGALAEAMQGPLASYRAYLERTLAAAGASGAADSTVADSTAQLEFRAELAILDQGPALMPDTVISATEIRRIAGRELTLGLASRAVTAGDVWVFDASTRTLVAGDLVTLPAPFLDTACPAGWQAALAALAAVDFAILIPGHGPPLTRPQFETYRAAFERLLACAASERPGEECIAGWLADAGALIAGDEQPLARELLEYYVARLLRGDPPRAAKFCGE